MHDMISLQPDIADLYQTAVGQQGHFTSRQAHESGVSNELLKHHVRSGKFVRVYRGVYRFRDYPPSPREHIAAAWLAIGKEHAVVSHESALELLDLTDLIPYGIHITVPRSRRYARDISGVVLHTTTDVIDPLERLTVDGIPVTSPTRTIVDMAATGGSPEHVYVAVMQALDRGTTTEQVLRMAANSRSERVRRMIHGAIEAATP